MRCQHSHLRMLLLLVLVLGQMIAVRGPSEAELLRGAVTGSVLAFAVTAAGGRIVDPFDLKSDH